MKINIIGCGISGITAGVLLKNKGHDVEIFEYRNHIGGNCYDTNIAGTLVHCYGPHLFHTDDEEVFNFLSKYTEWLPFRLQPKGNTELGVISLPYSKKTINEIGRELSQEEIIKYIFKDYSEKQWGIPISKIPSRVINRIPKTKNCEDPTWFEGQKYQCIPKFGYTKMFEKMLEGIKINLSCTNDYWKDKKCDIKIYTGKIDEYFNYKFGPLPYRSLEFVHHMTENKMDTFIINQNRSDVPYTRQYDHSYLTFNHSGPTIITKEYSIQHNEYNIPFYPVPVDDNIEVYLKYKQLADIEPNTIFIGRLATYKYIDMWQAVRFAMDSIADIIK